MKGLYKLALLALIAMPMLFAACDSDDDENTTISLRLSKATALQYDEYGVWDAALVPDTSFIVQGLAFSHQAVPTQNRWTGFIPSRSTDVTNYGDTFFPSHQYSSITGSGATGKGSPYLVACWNQTEGESPSLNDASCNITYRNGEEFTPVSVLVNNTSWTYYAVLNGTSVARKFTSGDYLTLHVYGERANGATVGPINVQLANYTGKSASVISDWTYVNLIRLGKVKGLIFTMESTDRGNWGINTPTYFALDDLTIKTK